MTDPAAPIFERARALVDDYTLGAVKAWKAAHPGALAVGHMPVYTPRPLIEATGSLPVAVFGGGDSLDIIRGDSYFQSYICHIPRSTVELGLGGHLDALDGMVFPSICDVIRNLGGMWKMLFPQKYVAYLDLPLEESAVDAFLILVWCRPANNKRNTPKIGTEYPPSEVGKKHDRVF